MMSILILFIWTAGALLTVIPLRRNRRWEEYELGTKPNQFALYWAIWVMWPGILFLLTRDWVKRKTGR